MGPTAKAGLIFAMVALIVAGQLLEREAAKHRKAARQAALATYAELLEPLRDAPLPRPPGLRRPLPDLRGRPPAGTGAGPTGARRDPNVTYVVQPGDTLARIARKLYGSEAAWQAIYESNRAAIPDPARLKVGTTLRISPVRPPRPAGGGGPTR